MPAFGRCDIVRDISGRFREDVNVIFLLSFASTYQPNRNFFEALYIGNPTAGSRTGFLELNECLKITLYTRIALLTLLFFSLKN